MRGFKAAALLAGVVGLGFSLAHNQSQTTAVQQNSVAPIPPAPDAVVLHTEVHKIEDFLPKIPDRGAALFLLARRYAQLGDCKKRSHYSESVFRWTRDSTRATPRRFIL